MEDYDLNLLGFKSEDSLVRSLFNKEIDLSTLNLAVFSIPKNFKNKSFVPKKGLVVVKFYSNLEKSLKKMGVEEEEIKLISPGVCEAVKNAYEHGNLKDNSKKITFAVRYYKNDLNFFIGDEGGKIDGNLFTYASHLRESKKILDTLDNFYSFCGKNFSPLGHSGVGTKVMNKCFDNIKYFKGENGGLLVYLEKKIFRK